MTKNKICAILFIEKGAATSGLPGFVLGYLNRNRHLPEWRFLLLTLIVIVQFRTWNVNVIGMTITPFRVVW